jgi:beta-glucosidase
MYNIYEWNFANYYECFRKILRRIFAMFPFNDTNLSYRDRMRDLLYRLTVAEKIHMMTTHHHAVERLNIGEWYVGTEVARGFVGRNDDMKSTVFPQPIGMASTFDEDIMERVGKVASDEARAYYNKYKTSYLCLWGPTVDMERHPLWGRTEEGYGEDTCLTGKMSAAYTKGLVGDDKKYYKTIPTLKHFCANNNENNRGSSNSKAPITLLHEYYFKAFEPAIRFGGAKSVMTAYNEINQCPATMESEVRTILKNKWGLKYVVTDGGDFVQNVVDHGFGESHAEALAYCIKAGVDCFTDTESVVHNAIFNALSQRLISMEDIDNAIYNALYCRMKLGHFDSNCPYDSITTDIVDNQEAKELNRQVANEGVTLLKNDGILPLDKSKSVAVIGFLADTMLKDWYTGITSYSVTSLEAIKKEFPNVAFDNGFDTIAIKCSNGKYLSVQDDGTVTATADTITTAEQFELHDWGDNWLNLYSIKLKKYLHLNDDNSITALTDEVYGWYTKETFNFKTIFDSDKIVIEEYLFHNRVYIADDNSLRCANGGGLVAKDNQKFEVELLSSGVERVSKLVKDYDYAIVFTGNDPEQYARECIDRKSLELPKAQSNLVKATFESNKNTVMVLVSSYPYAINWENSNLSAIVYTSHAGAELGNAVCSTLVGENNPAGRTPMTWYKSLDDIPDIMEYDIQKGGLTYMYYQGTPLYPFGYGLSYSNFEYSNMTCNASEHGFVVSMDITNTSKMDGDEVVQLYYNVVNSAVDRPIKKLFDFKRLHIKAGETVHFEKDYVMLDPKDNTYFEFCDLTRRIMIIEDADYNIMIGTSSTNIKSTFTVHINGEIPPNRNVMRDVLAKDYNSTWGTEIRYCKEQSKPYVYCNSWCGSLTFKNCVLANVHRIQILATSVLGDGKVTVKVNGEELCTIEVPASDGFYDFMERIGEFSSKPLNAIQDIELIMTQGVGVLSFKLN